MGMIHAKCPECWDPLPCSCQTGNSQRPQASPMTDGLLAEQNKLLAEQNKLLRELVSRTPKL